MTEFSFEIPTEKVNFDDVDLLAGALHQLLGERVTVVEFSQIRTRSERAAAAFEAALGIRPRKLYGPEYDGEEAQAVVEEAADDIAAKWERADQLTSNGNAPAVAVETIPAVLQAQPTGRKERKDKGTPHKSYKPRSKHESNGGSKSGGPRGGIKAWRVMQAGQVVERITVAEKDRRLRLGEFAIDAELHHPRGGHFRVKMGDTADHIGQVLVPAMNGHKGD